MATEITSKSELESLILKLDSETSQLYNECSGLSSILTSVTNHDGIDVSSIGNRLGKNISKSAEGLESITKNLKNYIRGINELDIDIFSSDSENLESAIKGNSNIVLPTNSGNSYTKKSNASSTTESKNNYYSSATIVITPPVQLFIDGRTPRHALSKIIISPSSDTQNIDISKYNNNEENGFKVTTDNLTYKLCDEDVELLCAVASAESDQSYDDALAVTSTVLNRCENKDWIALYGRDPIAQVTALEQYSSYQLGNYEKYLNGNAPDTVVTAVKDALAGVRNHNYCNFNKSIEFSNNMITKTGNRYK